MLAVGGGLGLSWYLGRDEGDLSEDADVDDDFGAFDVDYGAAGDEAGFARAARHFLGEEDPAASRAAR